MNYDDLDYYASRIAAYTKRVARGFAYISPSARCTSRATKFARIDV